MVKSIWPARQRVRHRSPEAHRVLTTVIRHRSAALEGRPGLGVTRQESQPTAAREGLGPAWEAGGFDRHADAHATKPATINEGRCISRVLSLRRRELPARVEAR